MLYVDYGFTLVALSRYEEAWKSFMSDGATFGLRTLAETHLFSCKGDFCWYTFHISRVFQKSSSYESIQGLWKRKDPPFLWGYRTFGKGTFKVPLQFYWLDLPSFVWLLEVSEPTSEALVEQECSSATRPECLRFEAESTAMGWSAPSSWLEESRAQAMPMQAWTNCNRHKMSLPEASFERVMHTRAFTKMYTFLGA